MYYTSVSRIVRDVSNAMTSLASSIILFPTNLLPVRYIIIIYRGIGVKFLNM
jgi:hypothetical protein